MYVRTYVYTFVVCMHTYTHTYIYTWSAVVCVYTHTHTHTNTHLERSNGRRVVDVCLSTRACAVVVFTRVLEHFSVDVRGRTREEAYLVLEEVVASHVHE